MTKFKNFPTPHCHPKSLDSGSSPESFAKKELALETGYMTVTDHGSLGATREVYDLCHSHKKYKGKLKPILGVEAYFRDDNDPILTNNGYAVVKGKTEAFKYCHITLHCLDEAAFFVLCKKMSDADLTAEQHGSERKPIFTWRDLEELGQQNITATSGCLIGMVGRHLVANNDPASARAYYTKLRSIFKPGNFYVEVFPHRCDRYWLSAVTVIDTKGKEYQYPLWKKVRLSTGTETKAESVNLGDKIVAVMTNRKMTDIEPIEVVTATTFEGFLQNECTAFASNGDMQESANKFVIELAEQYGDPVLVSDDSHFAEASDKIVQDIRLAQLGNWRFANTYNRMSSEEAFANLKDTLGVSDDKFASWVENNTNWAKRFDSFVFTPRVALPDKHFPQNTLAHLMDLIKKHDRMDWNNKAMVDRLYQEINLLHKNGVVDLLSYFMIDEGICDHYQSKGQYTGPGRGSAAGVLIAYLLGITHVNPLDWGLSLDRFLTPTRIKGGKMPDIDLDLVNRSLLVQEQHIDVVTLDDGRVIEVPEGTYNLGDEIG